MTFENPPPAVIKDLLERARTIAVVGLSDRPSRTSHGVSAAMQHLGYRIIPVNPSIRATLGERAVPDLEQVGAVLAPGERVDIVNVFRRSAHVGAVVDQCIALGLPAIWLQEGVIDAAAAARGRDAGLVVVMDRCIYKDRALLDGAHTA